MKLDTYENVDWSSHIQSKANFHTHTTMSDVRLDPLMVAERYQKFGYSIPTITDHNQVTYPWTAFAEMEASSTLQNRMESAPETMPDRPVWGFSNDDMHTEPHIGHNWNVMILPELNHKQVRYGMENGLSYFIYAPGRHDGPQPPAIELVRVNGCRNPAFWNQGPMKRFCFTGHFYFKQFVNYL